MNQEERALLGEIADALRFHNHWLFAAMGLAIDARDRQEGIARKRDEVFEEVGQWYFDSMDFLKRKGPLQ
jgi:hypothetical protein